MIRIFITSLIFLIFSHTINAQVRILMKKEKGVYTTPCSVNGLKLQFIFDTGASNVAISLPVAIFMLKNGYLLKTDLKGSSYAQIANGKVLKNTTILIRELEIGGIKLQNIEASVIHELSAPLLLGQSAIQKLGKIQINGNELILLDKNPINIYASTEDEWINIFSGSGVDIYYNKKNIIFSGNLCNVLIKWVYLEGDYRNKVIADLVKLYKDYDPSRWVYLNYHIQNNEFDCQMNKSKLISTSYYAKDGSVIRSSTIKDTVWNKIIPGSIGELYLKKVCEYNNKVNFKTKE